MNVHLLLHNLHNRNYAEGSTVITGTMECKKFLCKYNRAIPKTTAFACHTLKSISEITNDILNKKIDWFWGIAKTGVDENKLVYKTFSEEITFDTSEKKKKKPSVKLPSKEFHEKWYVKISKIQLMMNLF